MVETQTSSPNSQTGQIFVARQPIFDKNKRVYAYELLYRNSGASRAYDAVDGNTATSEVIAGTIFAIGLEDILGGNRAFFNFTREHLLLDYSGILNPRLTVIEILESVSADDEVLQACARLRHHGFKLALDDFAAKDLSNPLANYADIIKVDFRATEHSAQQSLARHFKARGVTMLAEKVETASEFALARQWGYSLFQGYFFARPEIVSGKKVPGVKKQYYSLLCTLNRKDFDVGEIEAAIKHDLSLTYKFLLYLNSARFGFLSKITSIRHALVLLGEQQVRTWVTLAVVASLGADRPPELIMTGAIRAHFCELLGAKARIEGRAESLFVLGLMSVLDAVMGMPLEEVLAGLHLDDDVLGALLGGAVGESNRLGLIYSIVRAYEIGDWETVISKSGQLGICQEQIPPVYCEAIHWATAVFAAESQP